MQNQIIIHRYASPCGSLLLGSIGDQLCLCDWRDAKSRDSIDTRLKRALHAEFVEGNSKAIELAETQLSEFFAGNRREFSVPLLFAGSDFQQSVWRELLSIPYGETISYGELAARLGKPKAVRAVANANGANAMAIFVPCHRVIGSDRSLTGYAGGLAAKEFLINLEHNHKQTTP